MAKRLLIAALLALTVLGAGFLAWGLTPLKPMPEALAALESDAVVQVSAGEWTVFRPVVGEPTIGLVFYPGGRVDYRAYAPYLHALAQEGYLVALVPMPLNLAVFAPGKAGDVIDAYPQVETWVVGGHSLGGAMAANYASRHPEKIRGLVLVAAYAAESDSLSDLPLKVLSVSGAQDGLTTSEKIERSRALLPADAVFVALQGGNHAQFGWYGSQEGDGAALISREEQQEQLLRVTVDFMRGLDEQPE